MAASPGTVHALMDVVLTDGLAAGPAGILRSTVTVDYSSFQCGISSEAFSSVWIHRSAFMFVSTARPRTLRSKQSKTADTYSFPLDAGISVISVIHFSNGASKFDHDKPALLSLLETHIDIDEMIPVSFRNHFYARAGRTRKYPLQAFLWVLIIQRIFSIPTDQLLLTFPAYSIPLREFCGFAKIPDASKITRFKQDFSEDLQLVFDNLVDVAEPICQATDPAKADMTIFILPVLKPSLPKITPNTRIGL